MNKNYKNLEKSIIIAVDNGVDITLDEIKSKYSEYHRYWHNMNHLLYVIDSIFDLFYDNKINKKELDILVISALFHDIVYNTKKNNNEEKSVEYLKDKLNIKYNKEVIDKSIEIILNTKEHDSKEHLCKIFNKIDTSILESSFIDMLDWEIKVYKEYNWVDWDTYKKKRIEFLLNNIKNHETNVINIKNLIDFINKKELKIGICYFEIDKMPTIGDYIKYIRKINKLFDKIIILVVYNNENYDINKIKDYSIAKDIGFEYKSLNSKYIFMTIKTMKGDVVLVKNHLLINNYDKLIQDGIDKREIRTIYI